MNTHLQRVQLSNCVGWQSCILSAHHIVASRKCRGWTPLTITCAVGDRCAIPFWLAWCGLKLPFSGQLTTLS